MRPTQDFDQWVDSTVAQADDFAAQIVKEDIEKTKKALPYLIFNLKFNKTQARFASLPGMGNDNGIDINEISKSVGVIGVYYLNIKAHRMLHQFEDDKPWLIHSKTDTLDWKISKETKTIAGYRTIKATTTINFNSSNRGEITAWFTPKLPFSYGPFGLSGLPGLILGLERNHYYFYADTIQLKKRKQSIKKPNKGKSARLIDYYQYVRKREKRNGL